uniref:Uncharacterized protein n=2 Tax=Aegilops tauschii subsp. strangulata TaxID=200361 RepID=A0A453QW14_AEGTS
FLISIRQRRELERRRWGRASFLMGRLRKVYPKDVPLVSSVESADSLKDPFVPNDFADDGSNAMSLIVLVMMKSLIKLYTIFM